MDFDENINCESCKYGYFKDFSLDGWHSLCGADNCYICAEQYGYCNDYEEGNIPKGKERI